MYISVLKFLYLNNKNLFAKKLKEKIKPVAKTFAVK